jgi:TM2 domain-containing membrane protein YozV
MVFCRNCGGDLPLESASYCPTCGKPQNSVNAFAIGKLTKSNKTAVVIALIAGILGFNGIGHLYIGRLSRGVSLLIIGWVFVALTFFFIPFGVVYLIFWVWQAYDVNIKAKYFNNYLVNNGKSPW